MVTDRTVAYLLLLLLFTYRRNAPGLERGREIWILAGYDNGKRCRPTSALDVFICGSVRGNT